MAVTRTSLATVASATNASSYNTASASPTNGRLGVAIVTSEVSSGTPGIPVITGNSGQSWLSVGSLAIGTRRQTMLLCRFDNVAAGVINVAFAGVTQQRCIASIFELASDVADAIISLVAAPATNSGTSQTSGSVTLSGTGTYAVMGLVHGTNANTITPEAGWDQIHQDTGGAEALRQITQEDHGGGDLTPSATFSSSTWQAIGALFEEAVIEGPIALVEEGAGEATGNTTATLTFTGSIAKNELLIALYQVAHFTTYSITTIPPGWKVVTGLSALEFGAEANWDVYLFVRRAGISEPLTHQWITNGSNSIVHGARYSGIKSTFPVQTDTEYNSGSVASLVEGTSPDPGAMALWFIGWVSKHFEASPVVPTLTDSGNGVTLIDQKTTTGGTKNESAYATVTKNGTINITAATGVAVTGPRLLMAAFLQGLVDTDIDLTAGSAEGGDATLEITPFGVIDLTPGSAEGGDATLEIVGDITLTAGDAEGGDATIDIDPASVPGVISLSGGMGEGADGEIAFTPFSAIDLDPGAGVGGNASIRLRLPGAGYDPGGADAVRRPPRPLRR